MINIPGSGWWFPDRFPYASLLNNTNVIHTTGGWSAQTVDAVGEGVALIGRVHIQGRPSGTKTISSAGGKIAIAVNSATFANAGTTLRIGLQGLESAGAAPPARPDGTWSAYKDMVGGTDTFNAYGTNGLTEIAMASGTKSLSHGDVVCVVALMTARGGTDTVSFTANNTPNNAACNDYPICDTTANSGTSWGAASWLPQIAFIFDDGTLGRIEGTAVRHKGSYVYSTASSNPDEYGLIFTAPVTGLVDAICTASAFVYGNDAADTKFSLFKNPLSGSPVELASVTVPGDEISNGSGAECYRTVLFSTPVEVVQGQQYCVAVRATSTSSIMHSWMEFASADKLFWSGIYDSTMSYGQRDGGSGAFTQDTTKVFDGRIRYCAIAEVGAASINIGGIC